MNYLSAVTEKFKDNSVCILGMGYVGLTLATVMADVGFNVLGVEVREDILEKLVQEKPHFYEPLLEEKIQIASKNNKLKFTRSIPKNNSASVYFITVGTPISKDKKVVSDMIINSSKEISNCMNYDSLVVVRSTVKLGTTRDVVMPILNESGKKFDLAFCPERTLEGQALYELRRLPQIVGGVSLEASVRAAQLFQFITPTVVRVSNVETAELIKLIDNSYRDVSLAYANEVARICDSVERVSALEVVTAGKLGYSRTNLPIPGPVGGPCLEKDSYILFESVCELGIVPELTLAGRRVNERQPEESVSYIAKVANKTQNFSEKPIISLLGIAFKGNPPTDDLRGTMARPVLNCLKNYFPNAVFRGYDFVVPVDKIKEFGLEPCSDLENAFDKTDILIILNNHPLFLTMQLERFSETMNKPSLIYDFWSTRSAKDLHLPIGVGYAALGSHGCAVLPNFKKKID